MIDINTKVSIYHTFIVDSHMDVGYLQEVQFIHQLLEVYQDESLV